jgi:hypothetical protein
VLEKFDEITFVDYIKKMWMIGHPITFKQL